MTTHFSVLFICCSFGAGHNDLTCACYLAKAGLKLLVLEQYHSIEKKKDDGGNNNSNE
jgi:ribulose 1,5-bisphosphate synthetase/thiazole synthase